MVGFGLTFISIDATPDEIWSMSKLQQRLRHRGYGGDMVGGP